MKHILTFYNDIAKYPPILNIANILIENNDEVVILGYCSSETTINQLKSKGVIYYELIVDDILANPLLKFIRLLKYRYRAKKIIRSIGCDNSQIWFFNEYVAWLLHSLVDSYKCLIYLFEIPSLQVHNRFRLISPRVNYFKIMQSVDQVVCCEYNRAVITQSYFQLKKQPIVVPNKPNITLEDIPSLQEINKKLYLLCSNNKVILYQGIFNYPERQLEELCEAIKLLPKDFHLLLIGPEDENKRRLQEKYQSERIHFSNFLPSPQHLSLTKMSYMGFLSYHAMRGNIQQSLNVLYCAPNKIYEYALCGLPSFSNNLPALKSIYDKYKIGEVAELNPKKIAEVILHIDANYKKYNGFEEFLKSTDIKSLILTLIN